MALCIYHDISLVEHKYVDLLQINHLEAHAPVQQRPRSTDHHVVRQLLTFHHCKQTNKKSQ